MKPTNFVQIASFLFAMFLTAPAPAAEWTVGVEFATIQETVNAAASGDTIRIPAGDYYEQVLIVDKSLTLASDAGAVLHATVSMTRILLPFGLNVYPIIGMYRSQVALTGLTFEGERLGNRYQNAFYGIVFLGSGGRMENCTVRGFRGSTTAGSRGISVANAVSLGTPAIDVKVLSSIFADNERSIFLSGDVNNPNPRLLRTTFAIEGNTFTGLGPASQIAHMGMFIVTGAGGVVKANTMSGHSYAGAINDFCAAIFGHDGQFGTRGYVPLQPIRYEGNTFSNNEHHLVSIVANGSQVISNTFQGAGPGWRRWGSLALSGTNVLVAHNTFSNLPIGIELFGGELNGPTLFGLAVNTKLFTNRFCGVHQPIRVQPLATGTQESGTEIICPMPPPRDFHVPTDYATIQEAVNAAAPGDTIHIASGDYFEQIVIANKGHLALVGAPGAALHATTEMTQSLLPFGGWLWFPVLGIYRTDVVLSNLTFNGGRLAETYTNLLGIYFLGSGGRVQDCTFQGFRGANLARATATDAIYTDNSLGVGSPPVNLGVLNSTFTDNERSMHLRGDPVRNPTLLRTSFIVEGNTVTGLGPVGLAIDGVVIRNGAAGEFRRNTIHDHTYTGTGDPFSSGIAAHDGRASVRSNFVALLPVRFEGNTFSNNDDHLVLIAANGSEVINNVFHGGGPDQPRWGALAVSGTNVLIANNDFSALPTGIHLFGDDHFFQGWPLTPAADNVTLSANWFCNVAQSLRVQSGNNVYHEQGTQSCPFRAVFQSINAAGSMVVRSWHGQPLTIEASTDFRTWDAVQTYTPQLPTSVYREGTAPGGTHRFYRAVQ